MTRADTTGVARYLRQRFARGFYTFACSAHSPLFEEPARAVEILTGDVLAGVTSLAD